MKSTPRSWVRLLLTLGMRWVGVTNRSSRLKRHRVMRAEQFETRAMMAGVELSSPLKVTEYYVATFDTEHSQSAQDVASEQSQSSLGDPLNGEGETWWSGPSGPTNTGPTGPTNSGPTGPTNSGPTGPTTTGPTGPTTTGPTGPTTTGPTGPTTTGPTGPTTTGPTGPTTTGPTGPTTTGPTGPTTTGPTGPTTTGPTGPSVYCGTLPDGVYRDYYGDVRYYDYDPFEQSMSAVEGQENTFSFRFRYPTWYHWWEAISGSYCKAYYIYHTYSSDGNLTPPLYVSETATGSRDFYYTSNDYYYGFYRYYWYGWYQRPDLGGHKVHYDEVAQTLTADGYTLNRVSDVALDQVRLARRFNYWWYSWDDMIHIPASAHYFTDNNGHFALLIDNVLEYWDTTSWTATINWGDGTTSPGQVIVDNEMQALLNGSGVRVVGQHAYADTPHYGYEDYTYGDYDYWGWNYGNYLHAYAETSFGTSRAHVNVSNADSYVMPISQGTISVTPQVKEFKIATIHNSNPFEKAQHHSATIDWSGGSQQDYYWWYYNAYGQWYTSSGELRLVDTPNGIDVYLTHDFGDSGDFYANLRVTDDDGFSDYVNLYFSVLNDPPTASDVEFSTYGGQVFNSPTSVLDGASDTSDAPLTAVLVTPAMHGTLSLNANGFFTYTPFPGFVGTDTFSFKVFDGRLYSNVATGTIEVLNRTPLANDDALFLPHSREKTLNVLLNDSDPDGDPLTIELITLTQLGALRLTPDRKQVIYTPVVGSLYNDSFTYRVTDGHEVSSEATVSLTVTNTAPTLTTNIREVTHSRLATVDLKTLTTDADGDALEFQLLSAPATGTLTFNENGTLYYLPPQGFIGDTDVAFSVTDGIATTAMTLTLRVINHAPVAVNDTKTVKHTVGTALNPLVNDSDVDGDSMVIQVVSQPSHGSILKDEAGVYTYTPEAGFVGADSLTYRVFDGLDWSTPATFSLLVNNRRPVVDYFSGPQSYSVSHGKVDGLIVPARGVLINDYDADGDELSISIVKLPDHGTLAMHGDGGFAYTPDPGFLTTPQEPDYFCYTISDGVETSEIARVNLYVTNQVPNASQLSYKVRPGHVLAATIIKPIDVDNDELFIDVLQYPTHGQLTLDHNGNFAYDAEPDYRGPDKFVYRYRDAYGTGSQATANLTVNNTAPTTYERTFFVPYDGQVNASLGGHVVGYGQSVFYYDNYSYQIVNSRNQTYTVSRNSGKAPYDPESERLTFRVQQQPTTGTLAFNSDGTFQYRPPVGFEGDVTFTYAVGDGVDVSNESTVTLRVVNEAPIAPTNNLSVYHDRTLSGVIPTVGFGYGWSSLASDFEHDLLTFTVVTPTANGQLTLSSTGAYQYVPDAGYVGPDSFRYQVSDGVHVVEATVQIAVINRQPAFYTGYYPITLGQNLLGGGRTASGQLAYDYDSDAIQVTVTQVASASAGGTLAIVNNGSSSPGYLYIPAAGHVGVEQFDVELDDGLGQPVSRRLTFQVNATAPYAYDRITSISYQSSISGMLSGHDADQDTLQFRLVASPAAELGTFTLQPNGAFAFIPSGTLGVAEFKFETYDGAKVSNLAVGRITITNSAPTLYVWEPTISYGWYNYNNYSGIVNRQTMVDQALSISGWNAYDVDPTDNTQITYTVVQPLHGTASFDTATRTLHYVPAAGFVGNDIVKLSASAGGLSSTIFSVNIKVKAPNTPTDTLPNRAPVARLDMFTVGAGEELAVEKRSTGYWATSGWQVERWSMRSGQLKSSQSGSLIGNDSDPDGDRITTSLVSTTPNGDLKFESDGSFSYVPNAGFVGTDQFVYRVSDGKLDSNEVTVTIIVEPNASTPVAVADSYDVGVNLPLRVDGADTAVVVSGPSKGRVLRLTDRVHFGEVNLAQYLRLPPGQYSSTGQPLLTSNDTDNDGDLLDVTLVSGPSHGTLTLGNYGAFTYTPNTDYQGTDSFTYFATDGFHSSPPVQVTLTISNKAPTLATGKTYKVAHNRDLEVAADASSYYDYVGGLRTGSADENVEGLVFSVVTAPEHGTLQLYPDGAFRYHPSGDYVGMDRFVYRAFDGIAYSQPTTATIQVTNQRPYASTTQRMVPRNMPTSGTLPAGSDWNSDPLTPVVKVMPKHGTLVLNSDRTFIYTPRQNFLGEDEFVYAYNDGVEDSNWGVVTLRIYDNAPAAAKDEYYISTMSTTATQLPSVLGNDTDREAHSLTAALLSTTSNGQLEFSADGTFTYLPNPGFVGEDSFVYKANDTWSDGLPAVVTLKVYPGMFVPQALTLNERETWEGYLGALLLPPEITGQMLAGRVDWGDGTSEPVTIKADGTGQFAIFGGHTFSGPGARDARVKFLNGADVVAEGLLAISIVDRPPVFSRTAASVTKNESFTKQLATFVDGNGLPANAYTAEIDWGDGTVESGTVNLIGTNRYGVTGSHTYQFNGTWAAKLRLTGPDGINSVIDLEVESSHLVVVHGVNIEIDSSGYASGIVGTFTSNSPSMNVDAFLAFIDWGDGTQSTGSVQRLNGTYQVYGSHQYAMRGDYSVVVTVTDDDPGPSTATWGQATATTGDLEWRGANLLFLEDVASSVVELVRFTDPEYELTADQYTAVIDWGDGSGTTTATAIAAGTGQFAIQGQHTYEEEGAYSASITITGSEGQTARTVASVLVRGKAISLSPQSVSFSPRPSESRTWSGVIATFDDESDPNAQLSDYSFEIDWTDGVLTSGTLQLENNQRVIKTSREFSKDGSYSARIYAVEGSRSRALGTATVSASTNTNPPSGGSIPIADISGPGCPEMFRLVNNPTTPSNPPSPSASDKTVVMRATTILEGGDDLEVEQGYSNLIVARYTGDLSGFEAKIDWGDGSKSDGTLGGNQITGSHTYARAGAYRVVVTVSKPVPPAGSVPPGTPHDSRTFTAQSGVFVDAPDLQVSNGNGPFNLGPADRLDNVVLANITQGGEHAIAIVEWGDGEISEARRGAGTAQITSSGVQGTHSYRLPGHYIVRTTVKEGTQLFVTTQEVNVDPAPHAYLDFETPSLSVEERKEFSNAGASRIVATVYDARFYFEGLDQTATIFWGDGTESDAELTPGVVNDTYEIRGKHLYRESGVKPLRIVYNAVYMTPESEIVEESLEFVNTINVTAPAINAYVPQYTVTVARALNSEVVAMFEIPAGDKPALTGDFQAQIDWGDGVSFLNGQGQVTIAGSGTKFYVYGTHDYPNVGNYTATVRISEAGSQTQVRTVRTAIKVVDGIAGERTGFRPVAFSVPEDTSPTNVTIDWSDGDKSVAGVSSSGAVYVASGTHRYRAAGNFTAQVKVGSSTLSRTLEIAPARLNVPDITQINASPGIEIGTLPAFVFASTDYTNATNFTAIIDWGDGIQSSATVANNGDGMLRVTSTTPHTYEESSSKIRASVILISGTQMRVVPLKTVLDQQPDDTELFLYADEISADSAKIEGVFDIDKNAAAYEGQSVTFRLLTSSGQPTGLSKVETIYDGLASVVFDLPVRKAGKQFKIEAILDGETYTSENAVIVAGAAHKTEWHAELLGQKIPLSETGAGLPANWVTGRDLTVYVEVKDEWGNVLPDGTPVTWYDYGMLLKPELARPSNPSGELISELKNGRASLLLPNRSAPLMLRLATRVDDFESNRMVIGAAVGQINISVDHLMLYLDDPVTVTVTVRAYDVNGAPIPDGTPVAITDSMGLITDGVTTVSGGVATATMTATQRVIDSRTTGLNRLSATIAGTKSNSLTTVQLSRSVWSYSGADIVSVDHKVLSMNGNGSVVEIERPVRDDANLNPIHHEQRSWTTIRVTALDPDVEYKLTLEGLRGSAIYMSTSGPQSQGSPGRLNAIEIPDGSTSFTINLYSDGFDAASNQGMQKVRVALNDWSWGLDRISGGYRFGWNEVQSTSGYKDILVGDRNVATAFEAGVGIVGDFLWGALAGSDNLDAGMAGDMTLSLIPVVGVYTDVRDVAKQLWRSAGLSNQKVDAVELTVGVLGIVAEFFPPADYFVDGTRIAWKFLKHGRAAAQVSQILVALKPILEGAANELWDRAFGPVDAYAGVPGSEPPIISGGSGGGEGAEGEVGAAFWSRFTQLLADGGKKTKNAGKIVHKIVTGDPDWPAALSLISGHAGRRAGNLLEKLIDDVGDDFDKILGRALVKSREGVTNGDEIFTYGMMTFMQALSLKKPDGAKLAEAVRQASASGQIDEIAEMIAKAGKAFSASKIADPKAAKMMSNIIEKFGQSPGVKMAIKAFDDINEAATKITQSGLSAVAKEESMAALRHIATSIGSKQGNTAHGLIKGVMYEVHDFVTNTLTDKAMNGVLSKGGGNTIEQATDSLGNRGAQRVAREAMTFSDSVSDATKTRKWNQFRRYMANAKKGAVDVVEYAVPNPETKTRLLQFLVDKKALKNISDPLPSWLKIEVNPIQWPT